MIPRLLILTLLLPTVEVDVNPVTDLVIEEALTIEKLHDEQGIKQETYIIHVNRTIHKTDHKWPE